MNSPVNIPMKILGTFVLCGGLVILFMLGLGAALLTAPISSENNVEKIAGNLGVSLAGFFAACLVSLVAGIALVIHGRKRARQRSQEDIRIAKEKVGKATRIAMAWITMLAGLMVLGIWYSFRWNPDTAWAATVIGEADELQDLLRGYYEMNEEYPRSLDDLKEDFTQPTDFLTRNAERAGTSRWGYDRLGPDDYQLAVTAYSWVSYWDALVYRSSGDFAEPWFDNRDGADWRDFGKWRYVKGFSRYGDHYYFDAQGNLQQR